jgi:alpha-D-xyloside xylohydrolase
MFSEGTRRRLYLPPGSWIDYQSGKVYGGARWQEIDTGLIPIVLLVRDHTVLPHVAVARSTSSIDWRHVELRVFSTDGHAAEGRFALPNGDVQTLRVDGGRLAADPLAGRVVWHITRAAVH